MLCYSKVPIDFTHILQDYFIVHFFADNISMV